MAAKRQRLVSKESESKLAAVVATEQVVDAINVAGLPTVLRHGESDLLTMIA